MRVWTLEKRGTSAPLRGGPEFRDGKGRVKVVELESVLDLLERLEPGDDILQRVWEAQEQRDTLLKAHGRLKENGPQPRGG